MTDKLPRQKIGLTSRSEVSPNKSGRTRRAVHEACGLGQSEHKEKKRQKPKGAGEYTPAKVAQIVGVSVRTIQRWADAGILPFVRDSRGWRWLTIQPFA